MRNMGGIMRAPTKGVYFEIPYSGTHATGDCILVTSSGAMPSVEAYYDGARWVYGEYIISFSDENNVISFRTRHILTDNIGSAALIPGPNHV